QYAHALAARLREATLVDGDGGISAAIQAGRLPVLAPYRWLRAADPLPHSWEVTSDTIAAWLAGELRARRVVLIKPAHALDSKTIVDSYFLRTLPHGVEHLIVTADGPPARSGREGRAPRRLGRAGPPRERAILGPSVPRHTPRPARPRYRRRASARARGPGRRGLRRARRTIPRRARPRPRRPPQPGTRLRTRAHAWSRYRAARRPRRCARRRRRRARAAGSPRSASPHRRPAPTESPQPSPPPVERHPPAEPPAPRS